MEPGIGGEISATRARIVFVCTANRCRSPLAAALFQQAAASRGVIVEALSAGLLHAGAPVPPDGIRIAQQYGLDLRDHRSTQMTAEIIDGADLVLGMAREHAREAVALVPERWPRTFTLLQFVRWLESANLPRRASLGDYLDRVAGDRSRTSLVGSDPEDEVADPMGRSLSVWRQTATILRAATVRLAASLAPILL